MAYDFIGNFFMMAIDCQKINEESIQHVEPWTKAES